MAIGAGLGVVFTGISSHWLLNSAIPTWSVKKLSEQFNDYLKRREEMIAKGQLSEADAERIRFERDIAKRIGAPLLGAFSFASGAVMMTNILDPKNITDRGSAKLARDIAQQIEQTMTYPGEVKVVVMRETRAVGVAK